MQRTLNYTGRRKIEQKEAQFSITAIPDEAPEFNVLFSFDDSLYPVNALLYVEAYYKETRQRFYFGKVSKIIPPPNHKLDQIDLSGPTLFRVLIVDEGGKHGLLLASGEKFRAAADGNNDENKSSIFPVVTRPLGQLTWKVEFQTGGKPELCLNENIPFAIEKMKTDSVFQSLILPAALKEVIIFYLWNDDIDEDSEDYLQWMAFAQMFADKKPETEDPYELYNWVDEVVDEFSTRFGLCDMLSLSYKDDE